MTAMSLWVCDELKNKQGIFPGCTFRGVFLECFFKKNLENKVGCFHSIGIGSDNRW